MVPLAKYVALLLMSGTAEAIAIAINAASQDGTTELSRSRHETWNAGSETILNSHVAVEMAASVQYRAMHAYADRDHVNLRKSGALFAVKAKKAFEIAFELMAYQVTRGGVVEIKDIDPPVHEFPATADKADARVLFEAALALEQRRYDSLLAVHATCATHADPQCQHQIEGYLEDQVKAVDRMARYVADLDRVGRSGHAVWDFDVELEAS